MKGPLQPKEKVKAAQKHVGDDVESLKKRVAELDTLVRKRSDVLSDLEVRIALCEKDNYEKKTKKQEMIQFLEDYGLQWKGGPSPAQQTYPNGPVDMVLFEKQIKSLNDLAEKTKTKFVQQDGVSRLNRIELITITLKNSGFVINSGELRNYGEPESDLFFLDIFEGYYPSEFQKEHPDGVKLRYIDERSMFKGKAHVIAEDETPVKEQSSESIKVRLPNNENKMIPVEASTKIRAIRRAIRPFLQNDNFELCAPPSRDPLDDDATLQSLGLFPHGLLFVTMM